MQSKRHSAMEVITGTVFGLVINWLIAYLCMTLAPSPSVAASVTVTLCTIHSLVRGYAIRRWFAAREG